MSLLFITQYLEALINKNIVLYLKPPSGSARNETLTSNIKQGCNAVEAVYQRGIAPCIVLNPVT